LAGFFCLYYDKDLRYNRNPSSFAYNTQGPGLTWGLVLFMVQPVLAVLVDVACCAAERSS
jgi:hypothetical protein